MEENVFVDDVEICEICDMDENFDLHILFGWLMKKICQWNFDLHILFGEIRSDKFVKENECVNLVNKKRRKFWFGMWGKNNCYWKICWLGISSR